MSTYASYAPRFKPPKYQNKGRLIKGHIENDFMRKKTISQLNIVLFGCGAIGSKTLQTIIENRELHSKVFNHRYNIKAIFDSSGFVYNGNNTGDYDSCISDSTLVNVLDWKTKNKNPLRIFRDIGHYYTDFERMKPNLLGGNNTIIIDTSHTNNEQLHDIFLEHSKKGGGVVLSNKNPLTSSQHIFDSLMSPERLPRIGYDATIGCGFPFTSTLQNIMVSGDNIYKIEGELSSGVNWILRQMYQTTRPFAQIVMEAHSKGLAQSDPRDDILGMDNARKALILARCLGINAELSDVLQNTTSLLPMDRHKLMEMNPEQFTKYIKNINGDELKQYLLESCNGNNPGNDGINMKYVTCINTETEQISIELKNDVNSLNDHLDERTNIIKCTTDCYPEGNPLIIQGVSSGSINSVHSIMSDLYKVGIAINHMY